MAFASLSQEASLQSVQITPPGSIGDEEGYDPNIFVTSPTNYICHECQKVLRSPRQLECGHRYCNKCCEKLLSQSDNPVCQVEDCKERIDHEEIVKDHVARRDIMLLPVFCEFRNKGCNKKVKLKSLQNHLHECDFTVIYCIHKKMGCTFQVERRFLAEHLASQCLYSTLAKVDTQLGIHDVRLAEQDLRLQVLETTCYDGILIWKIKDFAKRKREALNERTLSFYSQPFYTSKYGYKMCARVYLNGDGMGKGTHMSLFFVVMKGDYDSLLQWPFRQKVTLVLLDQATGRHNLSATFRPDPTKSSFQQPTDDMNVDSDCPLFVSQSVLETPTYIKNDTLYIKVAVDTSDLYGP